MQPRCSRLADLHAIESARCGRSCVRDGAGLAVVAREWACERRPASTGQIVPVLHHVGAVTEARTEDHVLLNGRSPDAAGRQDESRRGIGRIQAGDVFEKVRLPGAVEIHIRSGVRIGRKAEILHLPVIANGVPGIGAEVIRDAVEHSQVQRAEVVGVDALGGGGGCFGKPCSRSRVRSC